MAEPGYVLIACDKFKGSLSASGVAEALTSGLRAAHPDIQVRQLPVADGGEGTLVAALAAGYQHHPVTVSGPTGQPVRSGYARQGDLAVLELADACGLVRLPDGVPAPLTASSRGFGELIRAALDDGARRLVLGIGGSASTDGGTGMLAALGVRLLDSSGADLPDGGGALRRLAAVDLTGLHPAVNECDITLATDVSTPLLGERGSVALFAAQKGAGEADQELLEYGLGRLATILTMTLGRDDTQQPGAGAAGGAGFAALSVLAASRRPGVEVVLDLSGFRPALREARLVITGEGSLDEQSLHGKAPLGVAAAALAAGVPVVAVCGRCTLTPEQVSAAGFARVVSLAEHEPDRSVAMANAAQLLARVAPGLVTALPG